MQITFMPQRRDDALELVRNGDALTINGAQFDFSAVPEGGILEGDTLECEWLVGDVTRRDGSLCLMLILPVGAGASLDARFPSSIDAEDGPIPLIEITE